jgi:early secretory antigenic target protein ESAT-6
MSLDGIRVQHAALDQAAEDMYQTVKEIDDRMNRLESELAPLKSDWHGNAQESYRISKQKWDWAIQELRDLLDESKATVYQSNEEYRQADARGAAQFDFKL